jgi:hypothetical protein
MGDKQPWQFSFQLRQRLPAIRQKLLMLLRKRIPSEFHYQALKKEVKRHLFRKGRGWNAWQLSRSLQEPLSTARLRRHTMQKKPVQTKLCHEEMKKNVNQYSLHKHKGWKAWQLSH